MSARLFAVPFDRLFQGEENDCKNYAYQCRPRVKSRI